MYKVEKVLVRSGRIVRNMHVVDDKISDLLRAYDSVRVIVSHPNIDTLQIGELNDSPFALSYPGSISELIRTGQITRLPLTSYDDLDREPVLLKTDLWDRDFEIEPADALNLMSGEDKELWPDLKLINRFNRNVKLADTHLLSVNGLIHPLASDASGTIALGANSNCRTTGELEMSLLEFKGVGKLNLHSLSCDNRVAVHEKGDIHQNGIYLRLNADIKNKVTGLVLLGHLHLLDGNYTHFDDDIIHVDLKHMDMETKIINHHEALGLSDVGRYLDGELGKPDLRNPSLIDYVLNNRSTFMFTLDIDELYREEYLLNDEGLPSVYSTGNLVRGIAQYGDGLLADYRQEYQDGLYCLQVPKRPSTNLIMKTTNYAQQGASARGVELKSPKTAAVLKAINFTRVP